MNLPLKLDCAKHIDAHIFFLLIVTYFPSVDVSLSQCPDASSHNYRDTNGSSRCAGKKIQAHGLMHLAKYYIPFKVCRKNEID